MGKARRIETFVMEDRSDAERLKDELEAGDDPEKIASVLGADIIDRIRLSRDENPSQLLPEGLVDELDYAEHKWYRNGERFGRYNSKQTGDGNETVLEVDDELVTEWLGDRALLIVESRTHYNGRNPDGSSLRVSVKPEE
jgi:hypothetical protein